MNYKIILKPSDPVEQFGDEIMKLGHVVLQTQDKSEPINSKDELLKKNKKARNKKEKELENKLEESKQYEERLKKIKK